MVGVVCPKVLVATGLNADSRCIRCTRPRLGAGAALRLLRRDQTGESSRPQETDVRKMLGQLFINILSSLSMNSRNALTPITKSNPITSLTR